MPCRSFLARTSGNRIHNGWTTTAGSPPAAGYATPNPGLRCQGIPSPISLAHRQSCWLGLHDPAVPVDHVRPDRESDFFSFRQQEHVRPATPAHRRSTTPPCPHQLRLHRTRPGSWSRPTFCQRRPVHSVVPVFMGVDLDDACIMPRDVESGCGRPVVVACTFQRLRLSMKYHCLTLN